MSNVKNQPESELLILVKEGSYIAFDEIYNRYWSTLFGSAYNILRDKDVCMDIIQDIFVWFWENRSQWQLISCKGYLLTAVKFKTVNYIRNTKNQGLVIHQLASIPIENHESDKLEAKQLEELIRSIANRLPDRCREIFQLSRYDYLSNKEIATRLSISEKTVENQITIALKKLREKLSTSYLSIFFF